MRKRQTKQEKLHNEARLDEAIEMTFPASDPVAAGEPTSTEEPGRPVDREAATIASDEVERARRGEGHKQH